MKTCVSAYFYFLKKFAFVRLGVYKYKQFLPPNVLSPFRCLYIDMPFFRENAFLTQNFTQDRRPNGRLLAPTPLTLRGGEFATQITKTRRYAARKNWGATHVKILPGMVAVWR